MIWKEGMRAVTEDRSHAWRIVGIDDGNGRKLRAVHESGLGPDYQVPNYGQFPAHLVLDPDDECNSWLYDQLCEGPVAVETTKASYASYAFRAPSPLSASPASLPDGMRWEGDSVLSSEWNGRAYAVKPGDWAFAGHRPDDPAGRYIVEPDMGWSRDEARAELAAYLRGRPRVDYTNEPVEWVVQRLQSSDVVVLISPRSDPRPWRDRIANAQCVTPKSRSIVETSDGHVCIVTPQWESVAGLDASVLLCGDFGGASIATAYSVSCRGRDVAATWEYPR